MEPGTQQSPASPSLFITEASELVAAYLSSSDVEAQDVPKLFSIIHRGLIGTAATASAVVGTEGEGADVEDVLRSVGITVAAVTAESPSRRRSPPAALRGRAGPTSAKERPVSAPPTPTKAKPKAEPREEAAPQPVGVETAAETVTYDFIICMEDGKQVKDLAAHLSRKGISPAAYRKKWGLPASYPMLAPAQVLKKGATFEYSLGDSQFHRTRTA